MFYNYSCYVYSRSSKTLCKELDPDRRFSDQYLRYCLSRYCTYSCYFQVMKSTHLTEIHMKRTVFYLTSHSSSSSLSSCWPSFRVSWRLSSLARFRSFRWTAHAHLTLLTALPIVDSLCSIRRMDNDIIRCWEFHPINIVTPRETIRGNWAEPLVGLRLLIESHCTDAIIGGETVSFFLRSLPHETRVNEFAFE